MSNHLVTLITIEIDFQNTVIVPSVQPKSNTATELEEADPSKTEQQKKPSSISSIHFFNTYSPSKGIVDTELVFMIIVKRFLFM